ASRLPLEGASLNLMEISVLPADDAGDPADGGATVA
ncbi:GNAT family N-acetyltransferase, partial [Xanthomonas citri pv. citri]|nr:GNAT family N-acetyltransferase [Xanthomonas citri pv. citri]